MTQYCPKCGIVISKKEYVEIDTEIDWMQIKFHINCAQKLGVLK